jgi:hypothetical protein
VAKCLAVSSEFTTFAEHFLETLQYEVIQMSAFIGSCGGDDDGVTGIGTVTSL